MTELAVSERLAPTERRGGHGPERLGKELIARALHHRSHQRPHLRERRGLPEAPSRPSSRSPPRGYTSD